LKLAEDIKKRAATTRCLVVVSLSSEGEVIAQYAGSIGDVGATGLIEFGKALLIGGGD
jgi:hypothetical protein